MLGPSGHGSFLCYDAGGLTAEVRVGYASEKTLKQAIIIPLVVLIASASAVSCGSAETETDAGSSEEVAEVVDEKAVVAIGDRPELRAFTRPNSALTYEQFVEAGWKQYQIYEVDTLPGALDARYGFYNRKDVEIRRYESYDDAMELGAKSAQEALERVVHDGSGFASRRVYGGYLVVGNLVMMCEVSTDDCLELIAAVEQRE